MSTSTIQQAKTNLSKLIRQAERGEEVLIARGKKVVAKIVPVATAPKRRRVGILRGKLKVLTHFSSLSLMKNSTSGIASACSAGRALLASNDAFRSENSERIW